MSLYYEEKHKVWIKTKYSIAKIKTEGGKLNHNDETYLH